MLTAFPRQKCLLARVSMLCYTAVPFLLLHAIKRRTFENFAELRYNIAEGASIFQCTVTLLPPLNKSLYIFIVPAGTLRLPWLRFFRAFFFSCKATARVKPANMGHGPHSSNIFVLFYVLFVWFCSVYCVKMCTVLLPPGGYPIIVKYIISYHIPAR
jgi:hypothetical protein